ncbi:hypothetical protein [Sphingomonas montanisoli]|uniref:Uncharacterized protein n=1 Tax=Sphingomonas montanisoli TaxID=2606412 RepID=A0A5D9BXA2_9SPHN|nr:hypothetical protein [Sphingomonas montanisoli]TZG24119.1 hypothetical protein FYJ91_20000 [Sphingomonas montanisoli]
MSNVVYLEPMIDFDGDILEQFRALSTPMLKRMWDNVDRWGVYCDEIWQAMQEGGEGAYVAI